MRKQAGKKQLNRKRNAEGAKGVKKETAVKDSVPVKEEMIVKETTVQGLAAKEAEVWETKRSEERRVGKEC